MKKVLIFSTAYLPMQGGAEIAVKEITDRLIDFEFDLICAKIRKDLPAKERIGRVNVWRVGKGRGKWDKFLFPWFGFRLAQKLYGQNKYDLVWAIMASFGGLAALLFKSQFDGVPYILTLQEGDSLEHIKSRARWLGPVYRKIFQKADHITAISNYLKEFAKSQNVEEGRISVVPNGVDLAKFSLLRSSADSTSSQQASSEPRKGGAIFNFQFSNKEEFKKNLGIKGNERVVITVSRLVEKNGVGDLIEAMALVKTPAKLMILGSGPLEENLKQKTEKLNLKEKIIFLGDIPNEKVPEYLAIADVFCRPSVSEGLGNSFLEAMACGVPVIGTNIGGIGDFLKDGQTGLFCKEANPSDLAQKIEFLFKDENLRRKLCLSGRQSAETDFNWEKSAKDMKAIFLKFLRE